MKCSLRFSFILVSLLPIFLSAQTVTGKLVDQNGNGLPGLQLQLYINPKVYNTSSGSDGTFTFANVSGIKDNQLPTGYEVSANYPNPFNPRTRMNISLPNAGMVRIELFNIIGQKVKDDINRNLSAGNNYIDIDLNGLPNGFYVARVIIDEKYTVYKKLMLLYGSQHLSASVQNIQLNKSTSGIKSIQDLIIDSLVVTGTSVGKIVFVGLPHLTGNSLDLGNLAITSAITITSLDKYSAAPGSFLTITGSGFDTTATLSIHFFDGGNFSVAIPIRNDNTSTLSIVVPPFINLATGGFEPGVVNVQVMRKSGTVTITSNTISGFQISALPTLTLPPGSVLSNMAGFLELSLTGAQNRLSSLDSSSGGKINTVALRSKLESLRILFGQFKSKIRESMKNPSQAETVGIINGVTVSLNQANLQIADQWMVAVINGILAKMEEAHSLTKQTKGLMNSHFQTSECDDDPELCNMMLNWKMVGTSEIVTSQQYEQSLLTVGSNTLGDLFDKFGAATAVIGAELALWEVEIPLSVVALLTAAPLTGFAAQFGMDAVSFSINNDDTTRLQRVCKDFDSGIQSISTLVISTIFHGVKELSGIGYDLYKGLDPVFGDDMRTFVSQVKTMIGILPSGDTYTGTFNGSQTVANTYPCEQIKCDISLNITITVSGSGSVNDPYNGSMEFIDISKQVLSIVNCSCEGGCSGPFPYTVYLDGLYGDVYGIEGKVEALMSFSALSASFTGGTINGNALTGKFTYDSYLIIAPIVKTITLTKI